MTAVPGRATGTGRRLAINRLMDRRPLDAAMIDRFLQRHGAPINEGARTTFLWRGEADDVWVRHRVVGLPDPLPLRRIRDTDLWYVTTEMPEGSRVEYHFEIIRGEHHEEFVNDPLNPKLAHGPFGSSSVFAATGYEVPDWCLHDDEARPGEVVEMSMASKALRRQVHFYLYRPARFRTVLRYPLLVVHDGKDYLDYASAKTVLDNLIHRNEVAEMVVAFVPPGDRLVEYANHAPHARFVARELVPHLTETLPLVDSPEGRTLDGIELRRGGLRCRRRSATPDSSARSCWSLRHSSSPTSVTSTVAARSSTRWSSSSTPTAPGRDGWWSRSTRRAGCTSRSSLPTGRWWTPSGIPGWTCGTSRPGTVTTGRTGATGCATG